MIKNYFKIAWRSIWRNKLFSAINILSLAIGLSASFVIGMMIYHDFSFDKFHPKKDEIYRLTMQSEFPEGTSGFSGTNIPLQKQIKDGMPGVEAATSIFVYEPFHLNVGNTTFKETEGAVFTDKQYFEIFNYQWLAGSKKVLEQPNNLVLSQEKAQKYFPGIPLQQVIGKTITYEDSTNVAVAGIVADFDQNTDLVFNEFLSLPTITQSSMKSTATNDSWNSYNSNSQMFVLLDKKTKLNDLQARLDAIAKKHDDLDMVKDGYTTRYALQPLDELHFSSYGIFAYGNSASNKSVLFGLLAVALFLLALGCINFINLNTAQATQRSPEIGIRKTLGSSKRQLIFQFLGETFLLTVVAGLVSVFFGYGLFKIFNEFLPTSFNYDLILSPIIIIGIFLLILLISLLAGTYPALVLSNFKPVLVLKSRVFSNNGKGRSRKFLTFFQFTIAQAFIIATILVGKQIHFMLNKDVGFKANEIAYVRFPGEDESIDKRYRLLNELKTNPKIEKLSLGSAPPASYYMYGSKLTYAGADGEKSIYFDQIFGDTQYLDLYNIDLLAGRKPLNDTIREYVINETMAREMGFRDPKEAVNKNVRIGEKTYPVVGVMKDFVHRSFKSEMEPVAFVPDTYRSRYTRFSILSFTIGSTNELGSTIEAIQNQWRQVYPDTNFQVNFVNEDVASFYKKEQRLAKLLNWATGLSILISVLGLLGLVIYTATRKTKEIGIRKVLGASLVRLNFTLCKEFVIPIALAILVAIPIAWYGIDQWLQDFAYRIDSSWWIFAGSAVLTIILAFLVMSIKTIQTALKNPVKSLRTE